MLDFDEKRQALNDPTGRFMVWSHRGDQIRYPENSIEGIISACMMGTDVCEIDVRKSADGVAVLMHDETLVRTTNFSDMAGKTVNGIELPTSEYVWDWTFEQLRCLRLKKGKGGDSAELTNYVIPTLEEAVVVAKGRMFLLCDKLTVSYSNGAFTQNDVVNIAFPIFQKHQAWDTMIYNGGVGVSYGSYCRNELLNATTSNDKLIPHYWATLNTKENVDEDWIAKADDLSRLEMTKIARFAGWKDVVTDIDSIDSFLNAHLDSFNYIKDKLRLNADCYNYKTAEAFKKLLDYGINGAMVNDPLSACQFVAKTYYDAPDTEEPMKDKTYDILFIGNSYTFYNSTVPTEFKNIAASAGYTINVDSVTKGGYTLLKFADSQDNMGAQVHEKLSTKKYDFVFIQEQSHTPVTNRENFYAGARALVQKIRDAGAVPVFYSTWGRQEGNKDIEKFDLVDNETMTWNLAAAYAKMGKELDVSVAYVGLAFRELYTGTNINLYHSDGSHPSPAGTFVAALTLFSTLFQVSTNDVTYDSGLQSSELEVIKEAVETTVFNTPKIPDKYLDAYASESTQPGNVIISGSNTDEGY